VRHHPLEYMLSAAANWVAVLVIGIPGPAIAFHALCGFTASVAATATFAGRRGSNERYSRS